MSTRGRSFQGPAVDCNKVIKQVRLMEKWVFKQHSSSLQIVNRFQTHSHLNSYLLIPLPMAVQLGDTILISAAEVEQSKADPIEIKWQQTLRNVSGKYIQAKFTVVKAADAAGKTGDETTSFIFIQVERFEAFSKKQVAGVDVNYTVVVDKAFQYGQKNPQGEGRWLVFHDTTRNPFQHRFIQGALQAGAARATEIARTFGFEAAETLLKGAQGFFGHPLHNF
ncbi:hypothetical protein BKA70DRAFT_1458967 [Coprinopsis sp. MPI-PUGE-AT-0042]|nr:hypothetical protein BKA70DRAFT_1458967 [Coprinopsis sp. MPI-PUGE-AT-0042]